MRYFSITRLDRRRRALEARVRERSRAMQRNILDLEHGTKGRVNVWGRGLQRDEGRRTLYEVYGPSMAPSPWRGGAVPSAATVARIVVLPSAESCSVETREPFRAASLLVVAIGGTGPTARCPSKPCTSDQGVSSTVRTLLEHLC